MHTMKTQVAAKTLHPWLSKIANAQSDLNLCWAHMFKGTFSQVAAQMILFFKYSKNISSFMYVQKILPLQEPTNNIYPYPAEPGYTLPFQTV